MTAVDVMAHILGQFAPGQVRLRVVEKLDVPIKEEVVVLFRWLVELKALVRRHNT